MDAVQPHRSPTYILAAIAALSVCVCFSGCSEMRDSGGPPGTQGDTTAPTVVSISPACNSTNVALNSVVTVTFSEALKASTVNSNTVSLSGPGGQVSGSVTYDSSSDSATVTPSTNLTPNATYTVSVGAGVTDLNGNALAQPFSCGFKTIGPTPAVISSTPTCSSAGVSLNIAITATFNTDLLASTVNGSTVSLTGAGGIGSVSGAVSYDSANRIVIFTPAVLLLSSSTYTFTITSGVQSSSGVALQSNFVCSFTTGTAPDTTPPTIISVSPNCNATNVSLNNIVTITFSEALKMSTVNSSTVSLAGPGGHVAGSVTYDASTNSTIFTPSSNLIQNVSYSVTATTGITDLSGNALAQPLSCSFTTAGPPTVISSTPSCNATAVVLNGAISATFGTDLLASTVNSTTVTLTGAGPIGAVSGTVSYSGATRTVIFTSLAALLPSSSYTFTITTGVQSTSGASVQTNFVCSFTTGLITDTTAPTITLVVPNCGASAAALNSTVAFTFSEAMDPATVNQSNITLTAGSNLITGILTYDAVASVALFVPSLTLTPNTTFTVTAGTGLKDLSGNALASNFSCSFTTGSLPDTTPPTVVATAPSCGVSGIGLNATANITFSEAMNPATINSTNLTLVGAGSLGLVNGTVTYDTNTNIATITPFANLIAGTSYTLTVTTGVQDLSGNPISLAFSCSFTTGASIGLTAPSLNTAANFTILAGVSVVNGINPGTLINGDVGVSPGTIVTGLLAGNINGGLHINDAAAIQAQNDLATAYNDAAGRPCGSGNDLTGSDLGGKTLVSGVYCFSGSASLTISNLTLDAQGDSSGVFIIQIPGNLTSIGTPQVILANGANAANVFWQVGGSVLVSGGTILEGNLLSKGSITIGLGGSVTGRLLSESGTVTLLSNVVSLPN